MKHNDVKTKERLMLEILALMKPMMNEWDENAWYWLNNIN